MSDFPEGSLAASLLRSVTHSLEQLVFFETEHDPNLQLKDLKDGYWFHIAITEPITGSLTIYGDGSLFPAMAEQLFSDLSGNDMQRASDDLGREVANTIAGHLMAHLFTEQAFSLGLPDSGTGIPNDESSHTYIGFNIEGKQLMVTLGGAGLLEQAEIRNQAQHEQRPVDGWNDPFAEADSSWGQGPEANPETGQWPATGKWAQE